MEVKEIIKKRRQELGLTIADVADACGVSEATVSRWENGRIANMKRSRIADLAKALQISPSVIIGTEEAEPESEPKPARSALPPGAFPVPDLSGLKKIPILGSSACGLPIEAIRSYDYIQVNSALRADFALFAEGKSMTGAGIMDGSMVFFRETEAVNNGEIAAVTVDNSTTIKRFYQYGNTVILRACNPEFDDQEYSGDELMDIHVFGKAVACMTGLN